MRSKRAVLNTISSLLLQLITVVGGFITTQLVLSYFGSAVNGLLSSIAQFLGYIVLLEAGAGGVIKAAFYKPLAEKNALEISGIFKASEAFFRKIAIVFCGFMVALAALYPLLVDKFEYFYTGSLILIIGMTTFAQYFFGITYQLMLGADQKTFIPNGINIISVVINTVFFFILTLLGAGIHVIRLVSAVIFVLRPLALIVIVKKQYLFDETATQNEQVIKHRWDGISTHIAFFIHRNTDIVVLTLFRSIEEVSVYSVYLYIIAGVEKIIEAISAGISAAMGNMLARKENDILQNTFDGYELMNNLLVTILFTSCGVLIIPFIKIYTAGITDISYIRPLFACLFVAAEALYCLRFPYATLIYVAGHYRQTRNIAYTEAGINIIVSLAVVPFLGMVGVAIGTLLSMAYRMVAFAYYLSHNILMRSMTIFVKRFGMLLLSSAITVLLLSPILFTGTTYLQWALFSVFAVLVASVVSCGVHLLLDRSSMYHLAVQIKPLLIRKKK